MELENKKSLENRLGIHKIGTDEEGKVCLTTDRPCEAPQWSPGSSKGIFFARDNGEVYVLREDDEGLYKSPQWSGSFMDRIMTAVRQDCIAYGNPQWSPGSSKICFTRDSGEVYTKVDEDLYQNPQWSADKNVVVYTAN